MNMDEEQEEKYLRDNGWFKSTQTLWVHKNCDYDCAQQTAVWIQNYRDSNSSISIISKIINKLWG